MLTGKYYFKIIWIGEKNSPVWTYFSIKDFEKKTAMCDQCGLLMSFRGTISNLKNHLLKKHPTINLKSEYNKSSKTANTSTSCANNSVAATQSTPSTNSLPSTSCITSFTAVQSTSTSLLEVPDHNHSSSSQVVPLSTDDTSRPCSKSQPSTQSSIAAFIPKKIIVAHKKKLILFY